MTMENSFLEPVSSATQEILSKELWGHYGSSKLPTYFKYYTTQCRTVWLSSRECLPLRTHQDIADIALSLRIGLDRSTIRDNLTARYLPDKLVDFGILDTAIDLVIRVVLMLEVGELQNAFTGRQCLSWVQGPAKDWLNDIFPSSQQIGHENIKLSSDFTACNLDRMTGFKMELTSHLADHLRLQSDRTTIKIFHQASFLKHQLGNTIFPPGLIAETLQSLALLFPPGEKKVQKWYERQTDAMHLDFEVLRCGEVVRQIERYKYWHDRLVILKGEFDDARPRSLSNWWNDRREGIHWYTLWIAIGFTIFFGLVQSIEGALQVYKAYHPS